MWIGQEDFRATSYIFQNVDRELHKSVIQEWASKFETYRTAVNLNKKSSDRFSHSGRPRTRTQQIVEIVQESVERSPKRSLRCRSQSLNLSMPTGRRVIVADLNKYPYRIQTKQKLTVADKKDMMKKWLRRIKNLSGRPW